MLGAIALLLVVLGNAGLLVARIGMLDRYSYPQYVVCGLSTVLAIAQFVRGGSRLAKSLAAGALFVAAVFLVALETLTHYAPDRPQGPASESVFPLASVVDAASGETIDLAPGRDERGVIVVCFRGFW